MSTSQSQTKTLRDIALASVPAELREPLLVWAAEHHVMHADDPYWPIAAAVANGMAAARAAGEAAAATQAATAGIPDQVYRGATRAGEDLRQQVQVAGQAVAQDLVGRGQALQQDLQAAIGEAAAQGGEVLARAVAGLEAAGVARRDAMINEWQAALARATTAGVAARMARSWGVVAASLVLAMVLGAGAALTAARLTGHLSPWEVRLATTADGCGFQPMPATDSAACRASIPFHAGPPFRPCRAG